MGTSASHSGPKSGISFDPPWLNDDQNSETSDSTESGSQTESSSTLVAPPARFKSARTNMSVYIKTGSRDSLTKSLGHYSHTGMGGAKKVANRMSHSANVASKLYSSFSALRQGNEPSIRNIINSYRSSNTDLYGLIDSIANYICSDGGSLDEVSSRDSISLALSDLFDKNPEIDILNLSDDSIWSLVTSFLGYEAFSRIQLDIGQGFETNDIPLNDRIVRLNDMREYLESEISSQINVIRNEIGSKSSPDLHQLMIQAIEMTFSVFEVTL